MHSNFLRAALLAVLSTLVLALTACGGSSDSGGSSDLGPDPISMAPADAPFYAQVVVRPEGSLGDGLNSALSKLLNVDDPGAMIRDKIDQTLASDPQSADFNYSDDIEPWLGSRAGVFVSSIDPKASKADYAVSVAVTDTGAAQAFLDKAEASDKTTPAPTDENYNGVDYKYNADQDTAYALVGDFLMIANKQGFEDAVDANSSGESLAGNDAATAALADAPDNSVFSLYADTPALIDLVKSSNSFSPTELKQLDSQFAKYSSGPIEAWGSVTDSSFAFSASSPTPDGAAGTSDLVSGFPADAWLAFAASGVGDQIQTGIEQFQQSFNAQLKSYGGGQFGGLSTGQYDPIKQFEQGTGLDLKTDLAWIGDVGGFVQGTSLLNLGAGLVITTTDESAASDAIAKLRSALESNPSLRSQVQISPSSTGEGFKLQATGGLPIGAEVTLQDGKVVAAVGADSVDDVLSPSDTLDGSDSFGVASDALDGGTPSFYLDFAPILDLIDSTGQADTDPSYQAAKPYLGALDYLVSGSKTDGDRTVGSLVLGVQESTASGADTAPATIVP